MGVGQSGDKFECGGSAATLKFISKATNEKLDLASPTILKIVDDIHGQAISPIEICQKQCAD
jgi:hypothetical protein